MTLKNNGSESDRQKQVVEKVRKEREDREKGYREQALKLFPWICARCGREFIGEKLRMLTVHHKDHDHDNNPKDGSNWELLCLYCHENEHTKYLQAEEQGETASAKDESSPVTYKAFGNLEDLLKSKK